MGVSVCLSVCVFVRLSQKPHVQTSPNFLYMLLGVVAWSSSDDSGIRYAFPVLWIVDDTVLCDGGPYGDV